jgi:hypothetical protein
MKPEDFIFIFLYVSAAAFGFAAGYSANISQTESAAAYNVFTACHNLDVFEKNGKFYTPVCVEVKYE